MITIQIEVEESGETVRVSPSTPRSRIERASQLEVIFANRIRDGIAEALRTISLDDPTAQVLKVDSDKFNCPACGEAIYKPTDK